MDCTKEDECGEAFIRLVVTCCDASELFEIAEEILDEMAPAIHGEVTWDGVLAIRFRRDDGLGFRFAEQFTQSIVVESLVGQQRLHVDAVDEAGCCDAVVALSRKQNEAGKVSERIDKCDDLCCQTAARASYGLMARPPFGPMPC